MIKLKVDPEEAAYFLEAIDNNTFRKAINENWHVNKEGFVKAQSILWLFCWAKTGMGSKDTAYDVQSVFDAIFPFTYNFFESRVDLEWARQKRYAKGDIERELEEKLR